MTPATATKTDDSVTRVSPSRGGPSGRFFALVILLVMATQIGGCGGQATVDRWQQSLTDYVEDSGNGDPNSLRQTRTPSGRPGFAVLGDNHPDHSVDVVGLLLGQPMIDDQTWLIYLVASIDRREVRDVRLRGVHFGAEGPQWVVGPADPQSLRRYLDWYQQTGTESRSKEAEQRSAFGGWPGPADRYTLSTTGHVIRATETHSDADWTLRVP